MVASQAPPTVHNTDAEKMLRDGVANIGKGRKALYDVLFADLGIPRSRLFLRGEVQGLLKHIPRDRLGCIGLDNLEDDEAHCTLPVLSVRPCTTDKTAG